MNAIRAEFIRLNGITPEEYDRIRDRYETTRQDIERRVRIAHDSVPHDLMSGKPTTLMCPECFRLEQELMRDAGLIAEDGTDEENS